MAHDGAAHSAEQPKLSWKEGLYLVGPDPLTSPYYSSGALIVAGVGYVTPVFQIGLYGLLFLLAPLYIEAVLLTLSNGGTYVMTRYALSHLGKLAIVAAAVVGVIISFSYVATAIVSLLSYADYLVSLTEYMPGPPIGMAILLSAVPAIGFGVWVMPDQWAKVVTTVAITTGLAIALSPVFPSGVVILLAPVVLLLMLNNYGLKESVQVSRTIFLVNIFVMIVTIVMGVLYLAIHGGHFDNLLHGVDVSNLPRSDVAAEEAAARAHAAGHAGFERGEVGLPGFASPGMAALIPAAIGASILGASGVESVMNIPEELERPRRDVPKIYMWMLSTLLAIGASVSVLIFLVLPPEELLGASGYLLAALGGRSFAGVTGVSALGTAWHIIIVANAALMLIGATNTGFAGARGLWITMARDNLLPRAVLRPNLRGAFERIHWLMFVAIFALCWQGGANIEKLERWYGATFGLVMFSGVVAFILLRKYKADDRRIYWARPNLELYGIKLPINALVGLGLLGFALLGLYSRYSEEIGDLQTLLVSVVVAVGIVLLSYNHRQLIRAGYQYFRRVIETVESDVIETTDRTIVVAVGSVRIGSLLRQAVALARAQTQTTGIPYRQIVVFHMTKSVRREYVYKVTPDSVRPAGIESNAVRIFTELTELEIADMDAYLALVPNRSHEKDVLHAAMDTLVDFHQRHGFKGHIVMVGDYGVTEEVKEELQNRLEGSTLVWAPTAGE